MNHPAKVKKLFNPSIGCKSAVAKLPAKFMAIGSITVILNATPRLKSSVEKNIKDAGETLHAKSSLLVNLKQKLINYEQLINLIQKSFK